MTVSTIKHVTSLLTIADYLKLKNRLSSLIPGSVHRAISSLYLARKLELTAPIVQGRVRCQGWSRC